MPDYADFDLEVAPSGDDYEVRVLSSPAGPSSPQRVHFGWDNEHHRDLLLRDLGRTRAGTRSSLDSPQRKAAQQLGKFLYQAAFPGEIGELYGRSLDRASARGVRLRLHLKNAPELQNLPWEFLYDPDQGSFLVLSSRTPIVRYPGVPEPIEPEPLESPLRVLVAISRAVPERSGELDADREWTQLNDEALEEAQALGLVELDRVNASLNEIDSALRKKDYHVFHYIGHSGFDREQGGVLWLEGSDGDPQRRPGNDLSQRLADEQTLRLGVFNSCEGALSPAEDPFAGVALSLIQKRLPAVVGMQFEITDPTAIDFSREFYTSIAAGDPVDYAVTRARQHIFGKREDDVEWGTPVLFLLAEHGRLFTIDEESRKRAQDLKQQARAQPGPAPGKEATAASPSLDPQRGDDPKPIAPLVLVGLILIVIIIVVIVVATGSG